ncbi:TROVE domain-containing protein [Dyella amyloliquefaciens]|uniref:TROVE domain-containing protein n=1 Tax=Dyella amyloliquefaciens TaxID=1770545 RepID=UPI00102ED2D9|nr:TROVE domain-containing protein [Dyella amyloliquefaciens]
MSNLQLFQSFRGARVARASAINEAGGAAYQRSPEATLALYATTGCLNGTFYADAQTQLDTLVGMCDAVSPAFVAKVALYARKHAHMKDVPALLLAYLACRDGALLEQVFDRVIDNGRMLRNFVQIVRSGVLGRKSLGSRPKRLVANWLTRASMEALMSAAIGEQPSLADVIRMVHPQPQDAEREALYAWLIGKPCAVDKLPAIVCEYEAFKADPSGDVPDLPFQYLTAMPLSGTHWKAVASRSSWQATRMNLNTFLRKGVFEDEQLVKQIAARLRDPAAIKRSRVFPYQLMVAYRAAVGSMPEAILEALQDAMEVATASVPTLAGNVALAIDVSGSMASPVTGYRRGATTSVTCVEVAALMVACIKRGNPKARVIPFAETVRELKLNARDSVLTQAQQMARMVGGGTSVSAPLALLNREGVAPDLVVIASDNQSWADTRRGGGTETMRQWAALKARNPKARLVCIDLQPTATSQAQEAPDVTHIGGFSDAVFALLADVARGDQARRWVERIEEMDL